MGCLCALQNYKYGYVHILIFLCFQIIKDFGLCSFGGRERVRFPVCE